MIPTDRIVPAYSKVRDALLAERNAQGHWEGELSTSALSTATAVMALEQIRRDRAARSIADAEIPDATLSALIAGGLAWLAAHQNDDGGWGDTVKSFSNISTTMLARATFHAAGGDSSASDAAIAKATAYIDAAGGVPALVARYGKDKTFSIPILTHCALAGLVDWKDVSPLPFELACIPAGFYKTVRLPVVSYALPALIAIGQVRHHFRRPWNPITRLTRKLSRRRCLRVLERIQPTNGGFLEATPLTSFVTMSLAAMGLSDHPVAIKGLRFIVDSVLGFVPKLNCPPHPALSPKGARGHSSRCAAAFGVSGQSRDDGSWPIDTNLATWVTTLSVNALGDDLPKEDRPAILDWLLTQQYDEVHPYTNADPGGWSWTDLPGGVPDADDTPGAILAINTLASGGRQSIERNRAIAESTENAIAWLINLQNRDGGFPTFCRGWGALPFDRSSPDITAHCLRGLGFFDDAGSKKTGDPKRLESIRKAFAFLARVQRADGSWLPLWFGNQHAENEENPTYGTARVLAAYRDAGLFDSEPATRGIAWLQANQNEDGGWGGVRGTPSSIEETALAVEILLSSSPNESSTWKGINWLLDRVEDGMWKTPSPIGFYFAKLWYFERLYPQIFVTAALRRAREIAMNDGVTIRPETTADRDAIRDVHLAAFEGEGEADLVDALRAAKHDKISFVAECRGEIIGHILFSDVTITTNAAPREALSLAPMAVLPSYQRQGVGGKLVEQGLVACRDAGHQIVVVLGHPDFYPRFGFSSALAEPLDCPFGNGDAWMACELFHGALAGVAGRVKYAPPFHSLT